LIEAVNRFRRCCASESLDDMELIRYLTRTI
jgi:hypothetical protein